MPEKVESPVVKLTPGMCPFLTKDLDLIKKQLYEGLELQMKDLNPEDLLDDINTDAMTPAWVCFDHRPEDIAKNAYAGLLHHGEQVFKPNVLMDGNFEVIVSGQRKGTGLPAMKLPHNVKATAVSAS